MKSCRNNILTFFILFVSLAFAQKNLNALQTSIGEDLIKSDSQALRADLQALLDSIESIYSPHSPEYAEGVLWTSMILEQYGDYKQSQRLLNKSNSIFKKYGKGPFNGRDTIQEILYLDLSSALNENGGRDYFSIRNSQRAIKLKKEYFGEKSEQFLNGLLDLSRLYAMRLDYKTSTKYHNEAFEFYNNLLHSQFCSLSDYGREDFWNTASRYINKTLDLADKNGRKHHFTANPELSSAAYNALLLSKGILLNASIDFERFVENNGNEKARNLLKSKRKSLQGGAPRQTVDSLDYEILKALQEAGTQYDIPALSVRWKDVQSALGPKDAAIEFYKTESKAYGAVLLKKDWDTPKLINLPLSVKFENKVLPLDSALVLYANNIQSNNAYGDLANAISDAIWSEKIQSELPIQSEGKVYFSCDDQLQLTGIEYLPLQAYGNLTAGEVFDLYRLSSTRVLVPSLVSQPSINDAALFGGLEYNMTAEDLTATHSKYPETARGGSFSDPNLYEDRGIFKISKLPMTLQEVQNISSILNSGKVASQLYEGGKGIEEAVKALSGNAPGILHFATHGFYIPKNSANNNKVNTFMWLLNPDSIASDNPLKRTGLIMAGAQQAIAKKKPLPDMDDGILTAYEISQLDLGNSDLIVLSACESGLGDITSDGVAGLQRGFKKAGSNCILMSLWQVDDTATYQLMVNFYKYWIGEKMDKRSALAAAQTDLRNDPLHPQWANPKYWAAFILLDALD